jgi:hypothetical protein
VTPRYKHTRACPMNRRRRTALLCSLDRRWPSRRGLLGLIDGTIHQCRGTTVSVDTPFSRTTLPLLPNALRQGGRHTQHDNCDEQSHDRPPMALLTSRVLGFCADKLQFPRLSITFRRPSAVTRRVHGTNRHRSHWFGTENRKLPHARGRTARYFQTRGTPW